MRERVLVAGIGNVFLGDDGFGVAVAQRLLARGDDAPAEPVEAHGLVPHRVLALVRALGGGPRRLRLVGCEPATPGADDDVTAGLSAAVAAAVEPAAALVASLVAELRTSAVPRA